MALIFGFDIGTTSIGFAVIENDPEQGTGRIRRLGVRIFPEARDPKALVPLNQDRRAARMRRRQLRRRRERRHELGELLHQHGLLPKRNSPEWSDKVMPADPYQLRKWAFNLQQADSDGSRSQVFAAMQAEQANLPEWAFEGERLSPDAVGRAIYHLAQRRHFKGRDLDEIAEDVEVNVQNESDGEGADDQETKPEREETVQALEQENKTLGAWLAERSAQERKRGKHATRKVVEDEFDRVWAPCLPNDQIRAEVRRAIFDQRPVFWRRNTLGTCRFLPEEEELCPRGSWLSQQRRMLEKLNNLQIISPEQRDLEPEERQAILAKLQTQDSMKWGGVRQALKPLYREQNRRGYEKRLKFNLEQGGEKKLLGNTIEAKLAKIFGERWQDHPHRQAIREALHERLWKADYGILGQQRVVILPAEKRESNRQQVARYFIEMFDVSHEQAEEIKELKLPSGWEPYSTKALQEILPLLEAGVRFGEIINGSDLASWREKTFPNHQEQANQEGCDRLPSPADEQERKHIASLRNPTVARIRNELRKVVNNLLEKFGKPDLIRVELARDVGLSKAEREERQMGMKRQEKHRSEARRKLQDRGISEPSRKDIEKWMLWEECGYQCPYTDEKISFEKLFVTNQFDVEHIWPRSRSLDDSFRNKTLCRKDANIQKGNQTPFECFGNDKEKWEDIKKRVNKMEASRKGGIGMSPGKIKRFLSEKPIPEDFTTRQLNDTAYAAKQVVAQLQQLWPDLGPQARVRVQAVSGRVTAQLRRLWGLNNTLGDTGEKNRANHRHHAVDALTIACTHPGMTQKLSRYWQYKDNPRAQEPQLPPPWEAIRSDAEKAVQDIVVSHRVRKKVSGRLHKETIYGDTREEETKGKTTYRYFVTRKNVEALSKKELREQICDDTVGKTLRDWVEKHGGDPKKAFKDSSYPTLGDDGPKIRKVRLRIKQQIETMAQVSTGYADLDGNHHVALYRLPTGEIDYKVVSLLKASQRLGRREPVIQRKRRDNAQFIMSLSKGDSLQLTQDSKAKIVIVEGLRSSGQIAIVDHDDAKGDTKTQPVAKSLLSKFKAKKISVDPIGRVQPAND